MTKPGKKPLPYTNHERDKRPIHSGAKWTHAGDFERNISLSEDRNQRVRAAVRQPAAPPNGMATPPSQPYSSSHESWAPYAGTSEINQSFSRQWFVFNNTGSFGFAKGYEHEVIVTNKSYVDESGYWSTNMPYSYNDCGNGGDAVDNFAIGCKIGWGMSNYTWYYVYHGFRANMSTTTSAKVQGARTKPGFPTCWSCWCFSSDAHTASPYIRFTSLPSGASWSY
jgi:hypothetical protein